MPDDADRLTPASSEDLADALAFALRCSGRKRTHDAGEMMAAIVSPSDWEHLERSGFVVMKKRRWEAARRLAAGRTGDDEDMGSRRGRGAEWLGYGPTPGRLLNGDEARGRVDDGSEGYPTRAQVRGKSLTKSRASHRALRSEARWPPCAERAREWNPVSVPKAWGSRRPHLTPFIEGVQAGETRRLGRRCYRSPCCRCQSHFARSTHR